MNDRPVQLDVRPMPNETLTIYRQTGTVIASVDAEDAPGSVVLALMPTTPYHVVAYVDRARNATVLDRPNDIAAAVAAYAEHSGTGDDD